MYSELVDESSDDEEDNKDNSTCQNCQEENKESDIKLSPSELLSKSIENYKLYLENEKDASDYNDVSQKIKELQDKLVQLNEKQ